MLHTVISGCQTGTDQGALAAARELGLATGGWVPRGFRTEAGPRPDLAALYGLKEHWSPSYPPRTRLNVASSDATLIFGDDRSPGCLLTARCCRELGRPYHRCPWYPLTLLKPEHHLAEFLEFLELNRTGMLNVAGNREETNPGIFEATRTFLLIALRGILPTPAGS